MSELVQREGFWVRADNVEQDLVVVRDIYQGDSYRTALLDGSAFNVVVDVGAHIGTFARLWHEKNPAAKIVCVEACPENIPALEKNAGSFARIIHAACSYRKEPLALLNAVRPNCESTGGSMVVPADRLHTEIGQAGYKYWHDSRPLAAVTLEDVMSRLGVDHIDLLKLDCEESEYDILANTPSRERIRFILGEYHGFRRWEGFRPRWFGGWDYGHMYQAGEWGGIFHLANRVWPPEGRDAGRLALAYAAGSVGGAAAGSVGGAAAGSVVGAAAGSVVGAAAGVLRLAVPAGIGGRFCRRARRLRSAVRGRRRG